MKPMIRAVVAAAASLSAAHAIAEISPAQVESAARAIEPKVITWRRDIHQHPELSNREVRTSKLVADHLKKLGLQVRTGIAHTGVSAVLKGGKPGPVIALRADMDALRDAYVLATRRALRAGFDILETRRLQETCELLVVFRPHLLGDAVRAERSDRTADVDACLVDRVAESFTGIGGKTLDQIDIETWDRVMAVNVRGSWLCAKASFPHMKKQGKGKIINISSVSGKRGVARFAA